MSTVKEIEDAVLRLAPENLAAFRDWFLQLEANLWDQQIESDVAAGKLDALGARALEDLKAGRCSDL